MTNVEPNSPEALKIARKVRSIFYFVAALNIVVIVIVFSVEAMKANAADPAKPDAKPPEPPVVVATTPEAKAAIAEMEAISEKLLKSYAAGDAAAFAQDFSPTATPKADAQFFKNVVVGLYQAEFGDIVSKKYMKETSANANYGMLVYQCVTKKRPKAKLSVNFRREGAVLKVVQWRIEKM